MTWYSQQHLQLLFAFQMTWPTCCAAHYVCPPAIASEALGALSFAVATVSCHVSLALWAIQQKARMLWEFIIV
jgi:hypothetical protein